MKNIFLFVGGILGALALQGCTTQFIQRSEKAETQQSELVLEVEGPAEAFPHAYSYEVFGSKPGRRGTLSRENPREILQLDPGSYELTVKHDKRIVASFNPQLKEGERLVITLLIESQTGYQGHLGFWAIADNALRSSIIFIALGLLVFGVGSR